MPYLGGAALFIRCLSADGAASSRWEFGLSGLTQWDQKPGRLATQGGAATAAGEVPGIYPGNGPGGIASELTRAFGARQDGIRARIKHDREVSLEMKMAVDYGEHIPTRGEEVRLAVARAIRKLTDLETREIKVKVTEVLLPKRDQPNDQPQAVKSESAESSPVVQVDDAGRV